MEFLKTKFEILLLCCFVVLFIALVVWGAVGNHPALAEFAIDNNKTFAGALLMALTGRAVMRNSDKNGGGAPPAAEPPAAPPDPPASNPAGTITAPATPNV
jgi:hypothetical protein